MNCIHAPQNHRPHWAIVNLLLVTATLLFFMSSCMTYQKAVKKFGHMAKDTTHLIVSDTVVVPKDSAVFTYRNDTATFYKEVHQGRARVIVEHTHTTTQVKAVCDPDTIYKQTTVILPPRVTFGVANWYQPAFWIVLAILGMIAMIVGFFIKPLLNNFKK